MQKQVTGVHLVGSLPYPTAKDAFIQVAKALPGRLKRIPDGEPARRSLFCWFQREIFFDTPHILRQIDENFKSTPSPTPTEAELESLKKVLTEKPLQTEYDDAAIESYEIFKSLRSEGVVASDTKFQVSLPTPINSICMIADGYQATVAPFYEDAIIRAVKRIEASIPHSDLAIQWDAAVEFAMIEGILEPFFTIWFEPPVKEKIIERLVGLVDSVSPDVECGLHLCYGDIQHQHFCQPKDTGYLVQVAKAVKSGVKRPVNYIQLPVPKDRTDDEYFAPLKDFDLGETELFLGLVHEHDSEGTRKRVETARGVGKKFGVSTECGCGRTRAELMDGILTDSAAVASPYE